MNEKGQTFNTEMKLKKTKALVILRKQIVRTTITLNNKTLEKGIVFK